MQGAIRAEGLVKTFGDVHALDGVDLDVPEGTVLGLLGPNGAGKTTAVRCLTTLLRPDRGRMTVAGLDVLAHPTEVRRSIGLSGQFAAVDEFLTGRENLRMVGELYQLRPKAARARADVLLERFHLADAADRVTKTYSGGMRRRLDLAAALVVSPPVMFMDEPTTGLDPRNRQELWEVIQELVASGTTLLLTTQYLEEADRLADDICVIDHGRVIARGTSDRLKAETGGERVEIVVHDRAHIAPAAELLGALGGAEVSVDEHTRRLTVPVTGGARLLAEVIRDLDARGIEIDDIALRRPTLDDVFISLTGHAAQAGEEDEGEGGGRGPGGRGRGGGRRGRGGRKAPRDRQGGPDRRDRQGGRDRRDRTDTEGTDAQDPPDLRIEISTVRTTAEEAGR